MGLSHSTPWQPKLAKYNIPIVVDKTRKLTIGARGSGVRITESRTDLEFDVKRQSRTDLVNIVIGITNHEIGLQEQIENYPERIDVDGKEGRPIELFKRRVEVLFGTLLVKQVMIALERELKRQVKALVRSAFAIYDTKYTWLHMRGKKILGKVTPKSIDSFVYKDALILVPYANDGGLADWLVANELMEIENPKTAAIIYNQRLKAGTLQNYKAEGFMQAAAQRVKKSQAVRNFTIFATFSKKHKRTGEEYKYGTPIMVVMAKRIKRKPRKKFKPVKSVKV